MTARKVAIQTIGKSDAAPLTLVLKRYVDGWTYEVQDLTSGALPLHWRAETMADAEKRLKESYDSTVWAITVLETEA